MSVFYENKKDFTKSCYITFEQYILFCSVFELRVYEAVKFFSQIIRSEHLSDLATSFIRSLKIIVSIVEET